MAKGKNHDRWNLLIGGVLSGALLGVTLKWPLFIAFNLGWMLSTFILSPDLDTMPKKRAGILRFFLYPYSLLFKHRGLSHSVLFGTLTRVFYGVLAFFLCIFVLYKMQYISLNPQHLGKSLWIYLLNYDLKQTSYLILTWVFIGMLGADLSHIFLDKVSSSLKNLF